MNRIQHTQVHGDFPVAKPIYVVLLAPRARFEQRPLPPLIAKALGRSQHYLAQAGEAAQLQRQFAVAPLPWSVAALSRQHDVGDAGQAQWLRADPVMLQADQYGARMMAYGSRLGMDESDVAALLPSLQAFFAEEKLRLDAPTPTRWYIQAPDNVLLSDFAEPSTVLGADLFSYLPTGEAGRRWRACLNHTQVLLHQHPHNGLRQAQGKPVINSLWFWGAGRLPTAVRSPYQQVRSPDVLLHALAQQAGAIWDMKHVPSAAAPGHTLLDLRHITDLNQLIEQAISPLLAALYRAEMAALHLDFADGAQYRLQPAQRWKFWRKPVSILTS